MARQHIPTDEQIAAWHAGGYIVERVSRRNKRALERGEAL